MAAVNVLVTEPISNSVCSSSGRSTPLEPAVKYETAPRSINPNTMPVPAAPSTCAASVACNSEGAAPGVGVGAGGVGAAQTPAVPNRKMTMADASCFMPGILTARATAPAFAGAAQHSNRERFGDRALLVPMTALFDELVEPLGVQRFVQRAAHAFVLELFGILARRIERSEAGID